MSGFVVLWAAARVDPIDSPARHRAASHTIYLYNSEWPKIFVFRAGIALPWFFSVL